MGALRIVVLVSGTGTNLQAILDELHGRDGMEVVGVVSNKEGARALERAQEAGVETAVFPREEYADREARDQALGDWVEGQDPGLVVLAGYMELLTPGLVGRLRNRVINVHPALLPAAIRLIAEGRVRIDPENPRLVHIDSAPNGER